MCEAKDRQAVGFDKWTICKTMTQWFVFGFQAIVCFLPVTEPYGRHSVEQATEQTDLLYTHNGEICHAGIKTPLS